jgi:intron-binding protein aquarius
MLMIDIFETNSDRFPTFFKRVLSLLATSTLDFDTRSEVLLFLITAFERLDSALIRKEIAPLISISIWNNLDQQVRDRLLDQYPSLRKPWKKAANKPTDASQFEKNWLFSMTLEVLELMRSEDASKSTTDYINRFLEFLIAIVSQLPTRRYTNTLLKNLNFLVGIRLWSSSQETKDLAALLDYYMYFSIDDFTGQTLNDTEVWNRHAIEVKKLQTIAFTQYYDKLRILALSHVGSINSRPDIEEHLSPLDDRELTQFAQELGIRTQFPVEALSVDRNFLIECFVEKYRIRKSLSDLSLNLDILPDENDLFNAPVLEDLQETAPLAIHKLGLQYLTVNDFLMRAFVLYRSELLYQIKCDISAVISRLKPQTIMVNVDNDDDDDVHVDMIAEPRQDVRLGGTSRMAAKIALPPVVLEVAHRKVGTTYPGYVRIEVVLELERTAPNVRAEWESLRPGDVVFLACLQSPDQKAGRPADIGLKYLRCAECVRVLDEKDNEIRRFDENAEYGGRRRKLHLNLDARRYAHDGTQLVHGFNVVIRRHQRENNFRPILATVRNLLQSEIVLPEWLIDVFLGFGDPAGASYGAMPELEDIDYNDTFLDSDHFEQTYEGMRGPDRAESGKPVPSKVRLSSRKTNQIRFTKKQVEAIVHGVNPGLTVVVGPPGTGKTDVATQILNVLYHNFPDQKTLVLAHSNQALNHIFEKIMALDIKEKHLLRVGHGEELLSNDNDASSYSKYGRVEHFMQSRGPLLCEVDRLAETMGIPGAHGDSCETASYFFSVYVEPAWELFKKGSIKFPFAGYFDERPSDEDECYQIIIQIFDDLAGIRPFELLTNNREKANFLMANEARIIAMTATHAAMNRADIIKLGFSYDNIVMEEAAQLTEIETFIPLAMQTNADRLKRVVLIGDHHQNAPIIQNNVLRRYAHLDQSLFGRLVRLGVPATTLDSQGRARPEIAVLYSWIYGGLTNLPLVENVSAHNPGFLRTYQFINVDDYKGRGETEPSHHFIQNLGEAEYAVALYQYMRLLGYPASKISILAAYYGQKVLIEEILHKRCDSAKRDAAIFGRPGCVSTVDQYQGEQNDYVIVSLVRSGSIGYLRDGRRITVALSRARLGLYVLGRAELITSCPDIQEFSKRMMGVDQDLMVVPGELYGKSANPDRSGIPMQGIDHFGQYVHDMTQSRYSYEDSKS